MSRGTRLDLTTVLLCALVGLLWWTIRTPYTAADDLATTEQRALATARILLDLAVQPGADFVEHADALVADARRRCGEAEMPRQSWPEIEPSMVADGLCLRSDTYLFLITRTPRPPEAPESTAALPPEVWAWPRADSGGLSAAFCVTPQETVATRNIAGRYRGSSQPPEPGTWRKQDEGSGRAYRGFDGNFWRPHPG